MEWISVKESLPKVNDSYIVFIDDGGKRFIRQVAFVNGRWYKFEVFERINNITHWMSLPEHPKD